MKKFSLLLISILLLSCSRTDSDSETSTNPIVGKWQKDKYATKKYPFSTAVEQDCGLPECENKYTLELTSNNTYKRLEYDGPSCNSLSTSQGNYVYDNKENTLKIDESEYEIVLSKSELKLISYSNYACQGSAVGQYQLIMTYKKIN